MDAGSSRKLTTHWDLRLLHRLQDSMVWSHCVCQLFLSCPLPTNLWSIYPTIPRMSLEWYFWNQLMYLLDFSRAKKQVLSQSWSTVQNKEGFNEAKSFLPVTFSICCSTQYYNISRNICKYYISYLGIQRWGCVNYYSMKVDLCFQICLSFKSLTFSQFHVCHDLFSIYDFDLLLADGFNIFFCQE